MKTRIALLPVLLAGSVVLLTSCASTPRQQTSETPAPTAAGKQNTRTTETSDDNPASASDDDLETYSATQVGDPWQPVNRVTFGINHGVYKFVLNPVCKVYEAILPRPARQGIFNVFENIRVPIRLVNNLLQGNVPRAGQEAGRFVVDSTVGVAGIGRPSNHIPLLADVPPADTAQTFSKWGIANGPYVVLPLLGPSTARDTVGLAGDYALNPLTWVSIVFGSIDWIIAIPTAATLRSVPTQMELYNTVTADALDPYLAARSAYIQNRNELNAKAKEPVQIERTPKQGSLTVEPANPEPKP